MLTLKNEPVFELEVKKSRFIAQAFSCTSLEEAKDIVRRVRLANPGANHVVHAAIVGSSGGLCSYSDDKEPKNTAGRPAFEVLKGSGITNICLTITRYFGGTLLGTGGLVAAYGDSAKGVLALCETEELIEKSSFTILATYAQYKPLKLLLDNEGATVTNEQFGTDVTIEGTIPLARAGELEANITELTNAQALVTFTPPAC